MAQDRPGRGRGARGREGQYGWGVPIRGMYSYSLDYGNLGGPETDSESIPGYDTDPGDWTGPGPHYEQRHWAAREPSFGEYRPRGRGGADLPGRSRSRHGGESWGDGYQPSRAWGGAARGPRDQQGPRGSQGVRWPDWGRTRSTRGTGFREELGGMTPAYGQDPWWGRGASQERPSRRDPWNGWARAGYDREFQARRYQGRGRYDGDFQGARHQGPGGYDRDFGRTPYTRSGGYPSDYSRTLQRWEREWERHRGDFHGDRDFEAYDRQFRRSPEGPRGRDRWGRGRSG